MSVRREDMRYHWTHAIRADEMAARHSPMGSWLGIMATVLIASRIAVAAGEGVFDVRAHGAAGDGKTLDTAAINKAVEACDQAGGGQVRFGPGRYLSATVHLKSHVTLLLEPGARLIGAKDPNRYQHPTPPDFMPEARWGKWHRALILGDGVEDIAIAGGGVIDGNKVNRLLFFPIALLTCPVGPAILFTVYRPRRMNGCWQRPGWTACIGCSDRDG